MFSVFIAYLVYLFVKEYFSLQVGKTAIETDLKS